MDFDSQFKHPGSNLLSIQLTKSLIEAQSLNDYMELVLPIIGTVFESRKICLIDYYENTNHFDLIHFVGYPPDYRFKLQRRFDEMEIEKALSYRLPYHSGVNPNLLAIPFHFKDVLEAVLILETAEPVKFNDEKLEVAKIISRFLGLFMSSTRLEVNRNQLLDHNDLKRAREIQLNFLPKKHPRTKFLEAFGFNSSSNLVGGDYFDYFQARDNSVQCILADACGHGMAAALIMSNFRGLIQSEILRRNDFSALFNTLNELVHFDEELIQYLTGIFLHFDDDTKRLQYLNAGHYEPMVFGRNGIRSLPGGGPPLGMFKSAQYPYGETQLDSGDLVALFTDGLTDIQNPEYDYFGIDGITKVINQNLDRSLEEITDEVLHTARAFSGGQAIEDDLTLFLLRVM